MDGWMDGRKEGWMDGVWEKKRIRRMKGMRVGDNG